MATINDLANSFIKGGKGSNKGPLDYIVYEDDLLALFDYVHNQEYNICEDIDAMSEILKYNVKDLFINATNFGHLYYIVHDDDTDAYLISTLFIDEGTCVNYDDIYNLVMDKDSITGYGFDMDISGNKQIKIIIKKDLSSIKLIAFFKDF